MIPNPYVADRGHVTDATDMIQKFGNEAVLEAASRADYYRHMGNQLGFCRWRQIERLILLMTINRAIGTVH